MIKCGRPPKGQETASRDRILDSALQLFLAYGYGDLSMEAIAKHAHVSIRTIYTHFGNKAGLFGAVIKRCSDQFSDSLTDANDPATALLTFARQFIGRITQPDAVRIRAILIGESQRFPELAAQFYQQGPQRTLDQLTQFFANQQQNGLFTGKAPEELADHFLSCLRNEKFYKLQLGLVAEPDATEIDEWTQKSVNLFLHGCLSGITDNIDQPE